MFSRIDSLDKSKEPKLGEQVDLKAVLLKIANFILYKVTFYAPYKSNSNVLEETSEDQAIHRQLWINTMRARNDKEGIRKLIQSWKIDITKERDPKYEEGWVKLTKEQCTFSKIPSNLI